MKKFEVGYKGSTNDNFAGLERERRLSMHANSPGWEVESSAKAAEYLNLHKRTEETHS